MSSKTANSPPITASKSICATHADVRAVRTLPQTATPRSVRKRSLAPTRSDLASGDSGAPSVSRPPRSLAGSKKVTDLELRDTLLQTPTNAVLELDELWSFVYRKSEKVWVWVALCRESRQIVSFVMGDRSRATCQRLWEAIPESYKRVTCYSDFWEAYQEVIPEEQHEATGKEQGETCHVERWINTLRQRLSRFVRKTLSFSKSRQMHHCCLKLFIHRYNLERRCIILG
jgi:insertion element IS1 protein InsB